MSMAAEDRPAVSVVMAAHNAAATLDDAIGSVLAQDMPDWELIIADDCSSDATAEILARYRDPRIRTVRSPRQLGAAGARNLGVIEARSDWLNHLDADDRLLPHALSTLHHHAAGHPEAAVIYANYRRIRADGTLTGTRHWHRRLPRPQGDVLRAFLLQNRMVNGGLALVRRTALEAVGGWPDHLRIAEDWALWVLLATHGPFHHVPGAVVLDYRQLPTGLSRTLATQLEYKQAAIDWIYQHPRVTSRFSTAELAQLKQRTQAQTQCLLACQQLRQRQWQPAMIALMTACRQAPSASPRHLAQAALAMAEAFT